MKCDYIYHDYKNKNNRGIGILDTVYGEWKNTIYIYDYQSTDHYSYMNILYIRYRHTVSYCVDTV